MAGTYRHVRSQYELDNNWAWTETPRITKHNLFECAIGHCDYESIKLVLVRSEVNLVPTDIACQKSIRLFRRERPNRQTQPISRQRFRPDATLLREYLNRTTVNQQRHYTFPLCRDKRPSRNSKIPPRLRRRAPARPFRIQQMQIHHCARVSRAP